MERGRVFVSKGACLGIHLEKSRWFASWEPGEVTIEGEVCFWWSFLESWCEPLRIVLFFFFKNLSSHWSHLCLHFAVDIGDLCGYFQ